MISPSSCHVRPLLFSIPKWKQLVIPSYPCIDSVSLPKLFNSRLSYCAAASKSSKSIVEEEDGLIVDEFEDGNQPTHVLNLHFSDELLDYDDGEFGDDYFEEDVESYAGDGAGGGGISLAGTAWDKDALSMAQEVALSFHGDLGIYAFKTLLNATIQVRIERLTTKSGSPSMSDIEAFTTAYRARLGEAEVAGSIPANIALEVSSPGVERIIRIPQDLERFKDRPMYVKYVTEAVNTGSLSENDGIFRLVSFDLDLRCCTWGLADVRVNREKAGKGRPLNKKQREWRLETPFDTLQLVRVHSEC